MKIIKKRLLKREYRKSVKYNFTLDIVLQEIIVGLMLGDLYAEKTKLNSNTRLQFKQSIKNKAYIDHLYSLFKNYCFSPPKINHLLDKRPDKKEFNNSIKFWTLSLPCFNIFRELFYNKKGIKIIPLNLEDLLTSRGLAYWIMDDGYKSKNGFYLCTESFTLADNFRLSDIFKRKFKLECSIHKHSNGYRLYVFNKSKDQLWFLVKPYIIDHFYYKFN
jgi:hypothetical protein